MESKQVQTCSIIWNYSSYKAPVISPRTKHNWHCAIGFLILFFRKEYILFSNVYISVNMIFECCYFFWLRNRPPIKYVRNWRNGGGSPKICTGAYRGRGVSHLMGTYALTDNYSFHVFFLKVSRPYLHQKGGTSVYIRIFSWKNFLHKCLFKTPL